MSQTLKNLLAVGNSTNELVRQAVEKAPARASSTSALRVGNVDDVMRSFYFLKERGVHVEFGPDRLPSSGATFLYFRGPQGMTFEYSVAVDHVTAEEEPTHRPREFPWDPWLICFWGAKSDIPEFRTDLPIRPAVTTLSERKPEKK